MQLNQDGQKQRQMLFRVCPLSLYPPHPARLPLPSLYSQGSAHLVNRFQALTSGVSLGGCDGVEPRSAPLMVDGPSRLLGFGFWSLGIAYPRTTFRSTSISIRTHGYVSPYARSA